MPTPSPGPARPRFLLGVRKGRGREVLDIHFLFLDLQGTGQSVGKPASPRPAISGSPDWPRFPIGKPSPRACRRQSGPSCGGPGAEVAVVQDANAALSGQIHRVNPESVTAPEDQGPAGIRLPDHDIGQPGEGMAVGGDREQQTFPGGPRNDRPRLVNDLGTGEQITSPGRGARCFAEAASACRAR